MYGRHSRINYYLAVLTAKYYLLTKQWKTKHNVATAVPLLLSKKIARNIQSSSNYIIYMILSHILSKKMYLSLSTYFCAGSLDDDTSRITKSYYSISTHCCGTFVVLSLSTI